MLESGYCYQRLFLMDLLMPDVSHTDACIEGDVSRVNFLELPYCFCLVHLITRLLFT